MTSREQIAERFAAADLDTRRFIDCRPGAKKSVDHTLKAPGDVSGEYGIYAQPGDPVAIIDIDDYGDGGDEIPNKSGIQALQKYLQPTLEQQSPHGGTHRIYAFERTEDGRLISEVLRDEFGTANPKPSWGEVRTANQYVVGAGSQLDGCGKSWCDACATADGGRYELQADRPIRFHHPETLVKALRADPAIKPDEDGDTADHDGLPDPETDADELITYAREADEKLDRLWRGNYSGYGNDRSEAECALAMKLGWWLQGDKRAVRRQLDRANTQKWAEREDDSYRESVLEAVDELSEFYDPTEYSPDDPAEFDPEEVQRGVAILQVQTGRENPAGELEYRNGCYGYEKVYTDENGNVTDTVFDTVCNFTIETLSILSMDGEHQQLKLRIHPQHPMEEPYEVRIEPSVFNSSQTFKEEIVCGRTTTFEPNNRAGVPTPTILGDLRRTVGSQAAPQRSGSEFVGLSDDYSEWVTPEGSLGDDGWIDDPDYEFYVKTGTTDESGAIAQKWQPDQGSTFDAGTVRSILALLPQIRNEDRGVPILGWFYAAPLKPLIVDWSGEFNLLQVTGETGSGKTTTLQSYWQLFGADENPFSASDTGFTIEKHMAESCGLPVWIDEYKPADIPEHRLDRLHRRLREVTRERTISKGTQSLDEITFTIRAPVVISGEQKFKEAAVRRRAVMSNLTQAATQAGTPTAEAFGKLTGTAYQDEHGDEQYPSGYDLEQHALAYYQWLLEQGDGTLEELWTTASSKTKAILGELGITVENTEQQGLQTVVFGTLLYRQFAEAYDVPEDVRPSRADLRAALAHCVSNIGKDGTRREHTDEWLELLTLASNEGYLDRGKHYKLTDSRKHDKEVLDVHMPSAFTAVMKYLREFNIEGEYTMLSKGDYLDAFRNKANETESYVIDTNVSVRGLENGRKCVRFDPETASEKLASDFTLSAFAEADDAEVATIASLEPGIDTTTVEGTIVDAVDDTPPEIAQRVTLEDRTGDIPVVVWADADQPELEVGTAYRLSAAQVDEYDGVRQVYLQSRASVTEIQHGVGNVPAADPGENSRLDDADNESASETDNESEFEQLEPQISQFVQEQEREYPAGVPSALVVGEFVQHGAPGADVEAAIESMLSKGRLYEPKADHYRTN